MSGTVADQGTREMAIRKAAEAMAHFERSTIFNNSGEISLGVGMQRNPRAREFQVVDRTATVRNHRFSNVVLDGDTLLLFKEDAVIPETKYFVNETQYKAAHIRHESLIRLPGDAVGIVAHNRVHNAQFHWLSQCLPAIDWSIRQRRDKIMLLLPRLQPWQENSLALLGYGQRPRVAVERGAQYLLPNAEYSEFLNGTTSFGVSFAALATARRLVEASAARSSPHKIIYLRNATPYYGVLANEDEVIRFLADRGVVIVSNADMTIRDRIRLFQGADIVIGPHDEGLASVLFCRPRTLVWELMPEFMWNACYNRLAQVGGLDYWGDSFAGAESSAIRSWRVDLDVMAERWAAISKRLAARTGSLHVPAPRPDGATSNRRLQPLDELMLEFESLGDNCEFGLVQRSAHTEPLGLLRFAGISFSMLLAGLEAAFEGIDSPDALWVELQGVPGRREFMAREKTFNLQYHTFMTEGQIEAGELHKREVQRLTFLRRKLLEDLKVGEKIWVWKQNKCQALNEVISLLKALRRYGPNTLLWVVEADGDHKPGTVERLDVDFLKGYIERFAPYENATDIRPRAWFHVCQTAYNICNPVPTDEVATENVVELRNVPLTAMEILRSGRPGTTASAPSPPTPSRFANFMVWCKRFLGAT